MKMKKRMFVHALALILAVALTACGSSNGSDKKIEEPAQSDTAKSEAPLKTDTAKSETPSKNKSEKNNNPPPSDMEETDEEHFYFEYDDNTEGMKIEIYAQNELKVRIPDKLDGVPVTSIGEKAFLDRNYYKKDLEYLYIPNTVKEIGANAFNGCEALTSIIIPDSVTKIDDYAFTKCFSLKNVELSKNITAIEWGVFEQCSGLTSIIIPDGVTVIEREAFRGCNKLENVTLPDSLTEIQSSAFSGCNEINITYKGNTYDYKNIEAFYELFE